MLHLEYAELTRRYQRCGNAAERTHWLVIRLLSQPGNPMKVEQVAEITGLSADWVRKFARRYNEKVSTRTVRFYDIFRRHSLRSNSKL